MPSPETGDLEDSLALLARIQQLERRVEELRREAEPLREHQEQTEFAMSVARVGVSYRDLDSPDLMLSASLADLLGLPLGTRSINRYDFFANVHPDDVERVRGAVASAVKHNDRFSLEYRYQTSHRGWRWFQSEGRVTSARPGQPARLFSAIADVTERRSLELQLHQAQKMEAIGQLAGGVAHDFNNLLTAIGGYSRLLLENITDPHQRGDVEEIVKAAERAGSLTKQLLAFSRRQVMETTALDINELVDEIAGMLRRIIGEDVVLTTHLGTAIPAVRGDRGQLEQVLMNLVVNARDATAGSGTIHIHTAVADLASPLTSYGLALKPGRYTVLTVSDTGHGMSEETKARVFEPFFTTKPRGQGTGLGLATVYGIVAQSGGCIEVDSDPGAGATFKIYFPPQERAAPATLHADRAAVAPGGSETILLAEDERTVRLLARRILQRAGYTVVEAANPAEAERLAASMPHIDLLLTDVVMPGGSGPELYRRLISQRETLRVLFMSGYAERDLFDRAQIPRAAPFLEKPFTVDALVAKVREVLDAGSARAE